MVYTSIKGTTGSFWDNPTAQVNATHDDTYIPLLLPISFVLGRPGVLRLEIDCGIRGNRLIGWTEMNV